jgi:hypothetical protein
MRLLHQRKDVLDRGGVLAMIEDACSRKAAADPTASILFLSPELYESALLEIDMPVQRVTCGPFSLAISFALSGVSMR